MKKILRLALGAILVLSTASCSDVLDATPDGRQDVDAIFADPELTASYFGTCFDHIPVRGTRGLYFWTNGFWAMADEGWDAGEGLSPGIFDVYKGNASASNFMPGAEYDQGFDGGYWDKYWRQIRFCNQFLERIPTAAVNTETNRRRWTAEVHVLRAFFYMELMRTYGSVPVVTKVLPLDYDYSQMHRPPYIDDARQVVADCDSALACPDLPWRITSTNEQGRMTKAIACAIKAEAALYAASPLNNGGENYWGWAYSVSKDSYTQLINNGYELYTKVTEPDVFKSAYSEYFSLQADLSQVPRDKETIWQGYRDQGQWNVNGIPQSGNYKCGICPTQELVDAYDMLSTGKPIYDLHKPYNDSTHLQPNIDPTSGYDEKKPYEGRDLRFAATVYYNGSIQYTGQDLVATPVEAYVGGKDGIGESGDDKHTRTGYYLQKHKHPYNNSIRMGEGGLTKYYRLGGVMLDFAECAIENGKVQEGIDIINQIRHRAGFSPSVDIKTTNQDDARLYVRHERQVELSFEDQRYYDERRWLKPDEDINSEKYCTGMRITKNNDGTFTYQRFLLNQPKTGVAPSKANYKSQYKYFPIPLSEATRMSSVTGDNWQHPGW